MEGALSLPLRDLSRAFLDANLRRLDLGARTRERIAEAAPAGELLHKADGTPFLILDSATLGEPHDDARLCRAVRESPQDSAYVIFGLGLGHTARALRAITDAPILVFDPDPRLLRKTLEAGPSDLGMFPIIASLQDLSQLWPSFGGKNDNVTVIDTPGYAAHFAAESRQLRETLTQLVQRRSVNDQTHRLRAREWVSDVLENVELLESSACFLGLAQKYEGVPAFIVGAGPSLGTNGALLADAAQKGIVFAVNSSALALAKLGVTPQVVACMESIDLSPLLARVPYLERVVRAFSLTAHPNTLRAQGGPLLPVYEALPQLAGPLQELCGAPGLPVCGSVSTLAFALAQRLGCSPIVFVGQDLAYTGGQAYALGSPYEGSSVRVSADGLSIEHRRSAALLGVNSAMPDREPLREVTAWGGEGLALSTIGFSAVRAWLEQAASLLAKECPSLRLVNATEGGARIAGFEERRLADVLAPLPKLDISAESLQQAALAARPLIGRPQLLAWAEAQTARARDARRAARRVRRFASHARSVFARNQPRLVTRAFAKLEAAEGRLKRAVELAPFVDAYSWSAVDHATREGAPTSGDSQDGAELALAREARIALAIESSTRLLEDELLALAQRLGASAL